MALVDDPPVGWFADLSDEEERDPRWPWQPFLQAAGCCFPLPVWFDSKEECELFIERWVAGRGVLPSRRSWLAP